MNKTNAIIPIFIGENSRFPLIMELLFLYQKLLVANVNNLTISWVKGGFNLLSQIPHEVLSGRSCPEGEPQPGLRLSPLFLSAVFSPAEEQPSLVYVIQTRKPGFVIFTFWPNCSDHLSREERDCVLNGSDQFLGLLQTTSCWSGRGDWSWGGMSRQTSALPLL